MMVVQVVALRVRSAAKLTEPECVAPQECDYALLLNRALPKDIRILGWSDVSPSFHARCLSHIIIPHHSFCLTMGML